MAIAGDMKVTKFIYESFSTSSFSLCMLHHRKTVTKTTFKSRVWRLNWGVSQSEQWSCSVVWWKCQQILLYVLSDGSRVNRLWLSGWLLSFSIFGPCADISLHWCHWCSADGTTDVLVGLITSCFESECFLLLLCKSWPKAGTEN